MSDQNSIVLIYDPTEKNPCCMRGHPNSFNLRIKGTWPDTKYFCTHIMVGTERENAGRFTVKQCGDLE